MSELELGDFEEFQQQQQEGLQLDSVQTQSEKGCTIIEQSGLDTNTVSNLL